MQEKRWADTQLILAGQWIQQGGLILSEWRANFMIIALGWKIPSWAGLIIDDQGFDLLMPASSVQVEVNT